MKKLITLTCMAILLHFGAAAQLGKQMAKYHEKDGVTVTQLDRSLYGLYQNNNLTPDAAAMLQKLDEVNILNIDLNACKPELGEKITSQFRGLLSNDGKYRLVKSHQNAGNKQLIYTASQDGKISDLVVWNQNPAQVDIIELRGDIELDKIASLSRILNIDGLYSLALLSNGNEEYLESQAMGQSLQNLLGGFFDGMDDDFFADMRERFNNLAGSMNLDSTFSQMLGGFPAQWGIPGGFSSSQISEETFRSLDGNGNVVSNSVQITEENGKTKLKIDSKNSDITYIIDGNQAPKDNVQMPEKIRNVNLIPSREDIRKSYLFVTSETPLGTFRSFKDGVLTFQYDNQEYQYNLDKADSPLLVIDGRLSSGFSIDPASILQIRPITQIEKEVGYYPEAQVIINTK